MWQSVRGFGTWGECQGDPVAQGATCSHGAGSSKPVSPVFFPSEKIPEKEGQLGENSNGMRSKWEPVSSRVDHQSWHRNCEGRQSLLADLWERRNS